MSPEMADAVRRRDTGCVAPRLGGSEMDCWGQSRIEHVKKEVRMSSRAEPRMSRLVELCQGHTEDGMRAGYIWCTDAENRRKMRKYLLEKEGD